MEEREALQLGSLLHDIGKLLERTSTVKLTEQDRSLEPECCPTDGNGYSHAHALYSGKFLTIYGRAFFHRLRCLGLFIIVLRIPRTHQEAP